MAEQANIQNWFPMSPLKGPPLPRFMNILWPWRAYSGGYSGLLLSTPGPSTPEIGGKTFPLVGWEIRMYDFVTGLVVPWGYIGTPGYAQTPGGAPVLKSTTVQAEGHFELKNIPPGNYMFIGVVPESGSMSNLALGVNTLPNSPVTIADSMINTGRRGGTPNPAIIEWIKAHPELAPV